MKPELEKRTAAFRRCLERLLPAIGRQDLVQTIEVDEDIVTISLKAVGIFVDVGYPVLRKSIVEARTVPGFRVGYLHVHNNYPHAPDEVEDVTECETLEVWAALESVAALLARQVITGMSEECIPETREEA